MSSVVDANGANMEEDREVVEMLNRMYLEADPFRTGQVRATVLVSAFADVLNHPAVDKWKMEELRRILDPKSDDVPVVREQFTKSAALWLESISIPAPPGANAPPAAAGDSAENRDPETETKSTTFIRSPRIWKAKPCNKLNAGVSRLESNASSLGLLNVSDLNESRDITFGSLNGTGSFGLFEIPDDAADLNGEEMKNMQKRLSDEKFNRETLRNQLEECEEENEELKKQLNRVKQELSDAKKTIQENEKKEKIKMEKERDEDVEDEDKENNKNLENAGEGNLVKLKEVQEELTKTKLREKEALDMADELKLKIQEMESVNEKTACKEKSRIKELARTRERLEEEIQRLQNDCTFFWDEVGHGNRSFAANGNRSGGGILGSAISEDVSFDNIFFQDDDSPAKTNFLQLPSAQSTPFIRRNLSPGPASIGEEFRKMGVQRRGLPFCEKNCSQDDLDRSRTKKKVVFTFSVATQTEEDEKEDVKSGLKALLSWLKENRASFRFPRYNCFREFFDDLKFIWREYPGRKKDAEAAKRWLKNLAKALLWLTALLLLFLILFTFFGAVNVDGRTLYPSTWRPQIGPFPMPSPFEFLAVEHHPVF